VTIGSQTATAISGAVTTASNAAAAAAAAQATANSATTAASDAQTRANLGIVDENIYKHIGGLNRTTIDGGIITTGAITSILIRNGTAVNGLYPFSVDAAGNMRATSATITGSISGSSISGSSISTISTPFMGIYYDQYRLNLYDTAKIRAEMRYQCDANGDGASITSYVDINNVNSAVDGARIGVTSSTGGNTQIRAGFVQANLQIAGPMVPTLAQASNNSALGITTGGYINHFTSLREYKYDIQDYNEYGLIDLLRPRVFKWKRPDGHNEVESDYEKEMREKEYAVGFIAEEIEEAFNGRFSTYYGKDREKLLFWKTDNVIAILVAEVQDLRRRVKQLEN
jgi:hypothetical protein